MTGCEQAEWNAELLVLCKSLHVLTIIQGIIVQCRVMHDFTVDLFPQILHSFLGPHFLLIIE